MRANLVAFLAGGLYLLSLALPALVLPPMLGGDPEVVHGWQCLLAGFVIWPSWIANPLLLAAMFASAWQRRWAALGLGVIAIPAALIGPSLVGPSMSAANSHREAEALIGYHVWLASIVLYAAVLLRRATRTPPLVVPDDDPR